MPRRLLKVDQWPLVDRNAWEASHRAGDYFRIAGKAAHWRPGTTAHVEQAYGKWLDFLGSDLDASQLPATRATEERLHRYVEHLRSQGLASMTIAMYVDGLYKALRVMQPDAGLMHFGPIRQRLQTTMTPVRNKAGRIRSPAEMFDGALRYLDGAGTSACGREMDRIARYRDGLMLAWMAARPIRVRSMIGVTLGHHLTKSEAGWRCRLQASDTKERRPLEFDLPDRMVPYLERYLRDVRPLLLKEKRSDHLWLSARGKPITRDIAYQRMTKLTEELFGVAINPHLFRDCAATMIATESPEHILASARILGHASLSTTERHYNQAQSIAGITKLHEVLADIRADWDSECTR